MKILSIRLDYEILNENIYTYLLVIHPPYWNP